MNPCRGLSFANKLSKGPHDWLPNLVFSSFGLAFANARLPDYTTGANMKNVPKILFIKSSGFEAYGNTKYLLKFIMI